ncbi:hypothetical protein PR202_gb13344 [Eleusine coracana subsp. coracana]|uniref:Uncharacterized protein n=1 Tax=Eleusine coracana subsp. coracana TaxID=191504 RepID=A0AAV5EQA6_ELECO|nr:hypothetical protein PR202_gb13344 [Eleusine coracana subsp. coracana]
MAAAAAEPPASAASSSSPPAVRIIDTVLIQPSPSSSSDHPAPPEEETSLPLTFFDIFWLDSPPVERLFLYPLAPDADADAIISTLKSSLSHAITAFYPLAGRIRPTPATPTQYELHYRPGVDGVAFTVAESDHHLDLAALTTAADARAVATIEQLLPPLPDDGAVLALQATVLAGGRGVALGVTVHHAACDGAASTHFLHSWAAAEEEGVPLPAPPVVDRSVVRDPRGGGGGLYEVFYEGRPTKDEMEFVKMAPDQLLATFVLSRTDLQRVKDAVAAEAARRHVAPPPRCSSLVATLGLVWSCYHRAKKVAAGSNDDEGPTCLLFPVDHRSRMSPPVPEKYLGNCVGPALAIASKRDLTQPGTGGVFAACAAVAAGIQEAVTEIGTPAMDAWMEKVREAGKTMGVLSVAGSPRFRVYDLDFGFGRPAKVDIVSVARTGAVAVAESRDGGQNGGGMEVGVSLQPDGMDRFRECFADAVAWLRGAGRS